MNLAIVIAVPEYGGSSLGNLPACKADGEVMHKILEYTGRFDEIKVLSNAKSKVLKADLANCISSVRERSDSVEEVFFYFSGHGGIDGDDFIYLLSDYADNRKKQTSLSNSDVDTMLRSLDPVLAVKVVDACHSGVAYIKEPEFLEKALQKGTQAFRNCYFLFSSQREQGSWQDSRFSMFTESFGRAIVEHADTDIRYKDIIDYISDDFDSKKDKPQTPAFVTQANFTEMFCTISSELVAYIEKALAEQGATGVEEEKYGLVEVVSKDAERYCTKEEAVESLDAVTTTVAERQLKGALDKLYARHVHVYFSYDKFPFGSAIAQWLINHDNNYFVEIDFAPDSAMADDSETSVGFGEGVQNFFWAVRKPQVIEGFHLTADVGPVGVSVELEPLYENVPAFDLYVVSVFSKVELRLFYGVQILRSVNWDTRVPVGDIAWSTKTVGLKVKESVASMVNDILDEIENAVASALHERFKLKASRPQQIGKDDATNEGESNAGSAEAKEGEDVAHELAVQGESSGSRED